MKEDLLVGSLRTPGQVHAHRNFVLDGHRQQRWRIDLEIGERGWNGPGDMGTNIRYVRNITVPFPEDDNLFIYQLIAVCYPKHGYDLFYPATKAEVCK